MSFSRPYSTQNLIVTSFAHSKTVGVAQGLADGTVASFNYISFNHLPSAFYFANGSLECCLMGDWIPEPILCSVRFF